MVQEIRDVVIRTRVEFDKGSSEKATRDAINQTRKRVRAQVAGVEEVARHTRRSHQQVHHVEMQEDKKRFARKVQQEEDLTRRRINNERRVAREATRSTGARVSPQSARGANPFSTGIPILDAINARGFQMFITVSTARIIGEVIAVGTSSLEQIVRANPNPDEKGLIAGLLRDYTQPAQAQQAGTITPFFSPLARTVNRRTEGTPLGVSIPEARHADDIIAGRRGSNSNVMLMMASALAEVILRIEGRGGINDIDPRTAQVGGSRRLRRRNISGLESAQGRLATFDPLFDNLSQLSQIEQQIVTLNKSRLDKEREAVRVAERGLQLEQKKYDQARVQFGLLGRKQQDAVLAATEQLNRGGVGSLNDFQRGILRENNFGDLLQENLLAGPIDDKTQRFLELSSRAQRLQEARFNKAQAEVRESVLKAELKIPQIQLNLEKNAKALTDQLLPIFDELQNELNNEFQKRIDQIAARGKLGGQ